MFEVWVNGECWWIFDCQQAAEKKKQEVERQMICQVEVQVMRIARRRSRSRR